MTVNSYVTVKKSKIHSTGVFAKKDISEGTRIIEYIGERITKAEAEKRAQLPLERAKENKECGAVYIFELNKRYDIDGNVPYNIARLINHSCGPNCETQLIRGHIWIISIQDIKKGEELSYNYGYSFDDYEEHKCRCNAKNCMGYILDEEHWHKLKKKKESLQKR